MISPSQILGVESIVECSHKVTSSGFSYSYEYLQRVQTWDLGDTNQYYDSGTSDTLWIDYFHNDDITTSRTGKINVMSDAGTNFEAPSSSYGDTSGTAKVSDFSGEHLVNRAVVIDITARVANNPSYELQTTDIDEWMGTYGDFPRNALVVIKTGYSEKIENKAGELWDNSPTRGKWPGFSDVAAGYLRDNYDAIALGTDAPTVDANAGHEAKLIFAQLGRYTTDSGRGFVLNNLVLDQVPEGPDNVFITSPVYLDNAYTVPARVIALTGVTLDEGTRLLLAGCTLMVTMLSF